MAASERWERRLVSPAATPDVDRSGRGATWWSRSSGRFRRGRRVLVVAALTSALLVACGTTTPTAPVGTTSTSDRPAGSIDGSPSGTTIATTATTGPAGPDPGPPPATDAVVGGDRPVTVRLPAGRSASTSAPAPLVLLLHGYQADGETMDGYLHLGDAATAAGMFFAAPDGSVDRDGDRFWNATDACCDRFRSGVDDERYLAGLVDEIRGRWSIDPRRIYVVGHSNGGFMAYRLACAHAEVFAAIVSFAGAATDPADACRPSQPVAVLQVHGTGDTVIHYDGGTLLTAPYPGARTSVERWVDHDGCDDRPDRIDEGAHRVVTDRPAAQVESWSAGCRPGGHVELWTVPGASHVPKLSDTFAPDLVAFLLAHPKP